MKHRIVLSSDWHADAVTAGFVRFEDVEAAVEEVVDGAIAERADLFAFLGDLADPDSPGAHRAAGLACRTAARLYRAGIPSLWLAGNHDTYEDGSGSTVLDALAGVVAGGLLPGSRVYHRPEWFGWGDVLVVLLPYTPRSHPYDPEAFVRGLPAELDAEASKVLVLGHLNLEGIVPGSESFEMTRGREVIFPTAACLERWGDRALLFNGHYHQAQTFRGVRIPGSLERLTFQETGAPGYLVVEVG